MKDDRLTFVELKSALQAKRFADVSESESPTAEDILARNPRFVGASWAMTRTWWTKEDERDLAVLCAANAPLERCADILGRAPESLASHARSLRLRPSREWRGLPLRIRKPKAPRLRVPREAAPVLAFPYIIKASDEHADILRVNALVPRGLPDHMRADVCQNIMLAVLEGKASIDGLERSRSDVSWFIKRFYREQMPYQEVLGIGAEDDERGYDEIAAAANVAWHESAIEEHNATRRYYGALRTAVAPTQENDVYMSQIEAARISMASRGQFVSWDEARAAQEPAP